MKYAQIRNYDDIPKQGEYPQPLSVHTATDLHGWKIGGEAPSNAGAKGYEYQGIPAEAA